MASSGFRAARFRAALTDRATGGATAARRTAIGLTGRTPGHISPAAVGTH